MINKKRRKKGKIKYKNIFLLLIIILIIVFLIKYINYINFNNQLYRNIKNNNLTIKTNKKRIKINKKNLDYIKKSNVKVKIENKNYKYFINNKYLSNETNLLLKMYNKRIKTNNFDNNKLLFIVNNNKILEDEISIKLPSYLSKNKYVDIYGINNKKYTKLYTKKVKNNINFNISKKYNIYAITFIKIRDIKVHNLSMIKNSSKKIKYEIIPKTSTIYNKKYTNINKKYINIKNNTIKALKSGKSTFNLKINNISKKINVIIKDNKSKIIKKDGAYYIDDVLIVNKSYPISEKYDPKDILKVASDAYEKMKKAAKNDDIDLWIVSGYRSYKEQKEIYDNYVKTSSKKEADTYSARPGYSEHQTGLAMDLNEATDKFNGTKEALWLEKNAYKYGFIIRFPKGKEKYTGYKYEPWHVRYIGVEKALKIYKSGLSLEEYYNLSSEYKDE